MPPTAFEAHVRRDGGDPIIDLRGEINGQADAALNVAYGEAESSNPATITLDFREATYINSTGIALIVGLLARARKARRRLLVYGLSEHYVEIFQITRLADFMTILPEETHATAS
jgi:anti-sigma B factor antagonist